ncbi:hypothetical protein AKO1_003332 [Acrasis kona]|uniref:Uncharacterized protein n=1 Tax=Acrasis kona TaxID=1008807 RepID=A0AAW2ZAG5_9EUKA
MESVPKQGETYENFFVAYSVIAGNLRSLLGLENIKIGHMFRGAKFSNDNMKDILVNVGECKSDELKDPSINPNGRAARTLESVEDKNIGNSRNVYFTNVEKIEGFDAAVTLDISEKDEILYPESKQKKSVDGVALTILYKMKLATPRRNKTKDLGHNADDIKGERIKAFKSFYTGLTDFKLFVFVSNHYECPTQVKLNKDECIAVFNRSSFEEFYGPLIAHRFHWSYITSKQVFINTDTHTILVLILNNIKLVDRIRSEREKELFEDYNDFKTRIIDHTHHNAKTGVEKALEGIEIIF